MQATKHRQLTRVCHRVAQWALQKLGIADLSAECRVSEIVPQRLQRGVETRDFFVEGREPWWLEDASAKHGTRVTDDARHMPHEFVRRADKGADVEITERRRRTAQRFLGTIGQRGAPPSFGDF